MLFLPFDGSAWHNQCPVQPRRFAGLEGWNTTPPVSLFGLGHAVTAAGMVVGVSVLHRQQLCKHTAVPGRVGGMLLACNKARQGQEHKRALAVCTFPHP